MSKQPPPTVTVRITRDPAKAKTFPSHAEAQAYRHEHAHELPGAVIVPLDSENWLIVVRAYVSRA
jgi:hypothetical protein